jgi:hypothetical protein
MTEERLRERRITLAISTVLLGLALPLLALSGVVSVSVIGNLPDSRAGLFPLSILVTFALFFATMAWRGFASIGRTGPALSVRGWRLLAGGFVIVAVVGAMGHWGGVVLPLLVAILCLYNDPAVGKILQWIGWSL